MSFLEPTTLGAAHVALVPLTQDHHDDLVDAVRDGALWKLWYTIIPEPQKMRAEPGAGSHSKQRARPCSSRFSSRRPARPSG